jgi:hypothetical protein
MRCSRRPACHAGALRRRVGGGVGVAIVFTHASHSEATTEEWLQNTRPGVFVGALDPDEGLEVDPVARFTVPQIAPDQFRRSRGGSRRFASLVLRDAVKSSAGARTFDASDAGLSA